MPTAINWGVRITGIIIARFFATCGETGDVLGAKLYAGTGGILTGSGTSRFALLVACESMLQTAGFNRKQTYY